VYASRVAQVDRGACMTGVFSWKMVPGSSSVKIETQHQREQPLCDRCGACCKTFPILVSIGDSQREPRIIDEALRLPEWRRTAEWEYQLHPLPFLEGCPFLAHDNQCSVYETRPDPCRRFVAGSPECNEARAREGLEALPVGGDSSHRPQPEQPEQKAIRPP